MSVTRTAAIEGLLVALWLGAAALFTLVVARAAFDVLPTRTLAGALVGRVLPVLFLSGLVVGVVLVMLEASAWRERWLRLAAGLAMAAACAVAQFVVAPRISALRAAIGGSIEALAADDAQRAAFGRLHAVSVAWLGVAIVAAALALVGAWRALDAASPVQHRASPTNQTDA